MGTHCALLLAEIFLHPYEAAVIADLIQNRDNRLERTFNISFHNIDYILCLNNSRFMHLPKELERKDTKNTIK